MPKDEPRLTIPRSTPRETIRLGRHAHATTSYLDCLGVFAFSVGVEKRRRLGQLSPAALVIEQQRRGGEEGI